MKKIWLILLMAMSAAICAVALAACGSGEHEHVYGDWQQISAPTCVEKGLQRRVCTVCGYEDDSELSALGHDWSGYTHNSNDTHTRECMRADCTETETEACSFTSDVTAPTCNTEGYTTHTCSKCEYGYTDTPTPVVSHQLAYKYKGEEGGKHTHIEYCIYECGLEEEKDCSDISVEVPATCVDDGYTEHVCSACSNTYKTDPVSKTGHSYNDFKRYEEDGGGHAKYCTKCGDVISESCSFTDTVTAATCLDVGYTTHKCSVCNYEYKDTYTRSLGHKYGSWYILNDPKTPEEPHTHRRDCENDGCNEFQTGNCKFSTYTTDPTCTEAGMTVYTCDICSHVHSAERTEKLGHDADWTYNTGAGTHSGLCRRCAQPITEKCQMVDGTENPNACNLSSAITSYCEFCTHSVNGDEEVEAAAHTWKFTEQEISGTNHTHTCTICNKDFDVDCIFTAETTQSTCTENGFTNHKCETCGDFYKDAYTDPTGHTFGDYYHLDDALTQKHRRDCLVSGCDGYEEDECDLNVTPVNATCTTEGYYYNICTECDNRFTAKFEDALGHDWSDWQSDGTNAEGEHVHTAYCKRDCGTTKTELCNRLNPRVTEPTCRAGYTTYYCDECKSDYKADPTSPTGHNWGAWKVGVGMPLHHTRTCGTCNLEQSKICSLYTETTKADCENDGSTVTRCRDCDRATTIVYEKLGHDYPEVWTHNEGTDTHYRECRRQGCDSREEGSCQMSRVVSPHTCTTDEVISESCSLCPNSRTSTGTTAPGHIWGKWMHTDGAETHYHVCDVCETVQYEPCSYSESLIPADCTTREQLRKECNECKNVVFSYTENLAYGHQLQIIGDVTDTEHHVKCMRDTCDFEHRGAHDYSQTNFCLYCEHDGLEYKLSDDGTHYIVLHDNNVLAAKKIIIPETHGEDGLPVTEISSSVTTTDGKMNGFANNSSITSLVLPETMEIIGAYAFQTCKNLVEVTVEHEDDDDLFSPALKEIGDSAFRSCEKLRSAANLPSTLKKIGSYAFAYCTDLTDITVPDGVEYIGDHAFTGTAYVRTHTSDGVLYIGKHLIAASSTAEDYEIQADTLSVSAEAFKDNTTLRRLTIHKGIRDINSNAFAGCTSLEEVTFNGKFSDWMEIKFANDLANPAHVASSLNITEAEKEITIPYGITAIPNGTFRNTEITAVDIPETVTYIGAEAFKGCTLLKTVTVHGNITEIGASAFDGSLFYDTPDNWDNGLLYLETDDKQTSYLVAVKEADAGAEIDLRENCAVIVDKAFFGNATITSVTTHDKIAVVGESAFENCSALQTVTLGKGLNTIYENAFRGCSGLKTVTFMQKASWLAFNIGGAGRGKTVGPEINNAGDLSWYSFGKWTLINIIGD